MRSSRPLAGALALLSLALAATGAALAFAHVAGFTGIAALALGIPVAVAAWLALGAPVRRRDLTGA